ncbi:alpha/beta hydrolase [Actinomycetospora sp. TBRC 11914]|uniref:alpha/beta hydrolase n=1 Tax=Actinomycetospora sp. TBRC 11914 TaxID=2729387 RepID=UPI00145FA5D7|nr:alpha/beta hydrolase [Actinomycetospora sp. TBRC 11914]NMO90931.1 alpha/beta hydrolase [Actinomycetospora sp. TBRC 11914]
MPVLDPACARLVHALQGPPQLHQLGTQDGREALRELQDDVVAGPGVEADLHTAAAGPRGLVGFLVVRPAGVPGPLPAVLHLHGGRFTAGDADTHGRLIRALATGVRAAVVVPEFTRVPEARYPVAVEEAYATLLWAVDHAGDLGLDPGRVAVSGDCTGATTATVLAVLAGRRAGPRLVAQLLFYPWADPRCDLPSHREFADLPVLPSGATRWYWEQYAGRVEDLDDPAFAPARAPRADLVGLPPALVVTAEVDVVRDEAEAYARAMTEAGVAVTCTRYLGVVHDFVTLRPLQEMPAARAALRQGIGFLADALGTSRCGIDLTGR